MEIHPFLIALMGGMCIGTAAALMMVTIGRITGISGITYNVLSAPVKNAWSITFLVGLIVGVGAFHTLSGRPIPAMEASLPLVIAGGFIVGIGTRTGRGCTSGHGICGLALFSNRSVVATVTFMVTAMITVFIRLKAGVA